MSITFRDILVTIQKTVTYTPEAINVASDIENLILNSVPSSVDRTHEDLVEIALDSVKINDFLAQDKKIAAIKHLRFLTNCGLKPAKDAIEDERVSTIARFKNMPAWPSENEYSKPPF